MLILKKKMCIPLLMFVISFKINHANECKIPENNEDIDWDKVENEWYLVLHTNDEVMKKNVIGAKLWNFTNTNEEIQLLITDLHKNSPPQTFTRNWIKQRAGVYREEMSRKPAVLASHTLTPDGGTNENAKRIDDALFNDDSLILCDEKNYMVHAFCSFSDEWIVWVTFPTLNPTIRQISLMWNKLIEKGIIVQLYPSKTVEHPELMKDLK
ncbi:uncharacterized protein LOC120330067 [Styela clava]